MNEKIVEIVTDKILKALEGGEIPWKKPFGMLPPKNLASKKTYRGINFWLTLAGGFKSQYWGTFKQIKNAGGSVKAGAKGTPVIFWDTFERDGKDGEKEQIPFMKYYTVFNVDQTEGLKVPELVAGFDGLESADNVVDAYLDREELELKESTLGRAYYVPSDDFIHLPVKAAFESQEGYYETVFHEMTHSTGHKDRLNRDGFHAVQHFGDPEYSKEELVAELGMTMLCMELGIESKSLDRNAAGYIQGWLKALKDDRGLLLVAAGKAQKAVDYILGRNPA